MTAAGDFELNIVAIPAKSKFETARTKRKNKYEKRRQRTRQQQNHQQAPKARQQQQDESVDNIPNESPPQQKVGNNKSKERGEISTAVSPQQHEPHQTLTSDQSKTDVTLKKKDSTTINVSIGRSIKKIQSASATTTNIAVSAPLNIHTNHTSSSVDKSRRNLRSSLDDDEERAKYLAEFHARPMELDRRSGARLTTVVWSKESAHLFGGDEDGDNGGIAPTWSSLGIHSRLIQTIQSPLFHSLQQPTTIQYRTIRAFLSFKVNNNKNNNENKKNILIHSETGSGKTLAYLLPIIQSIAYGGDNSNGNNPVKKRLSRSEMGCQCIILCPTRELASQTLQVVEKLCQANFAGWIVPGGLLGGDKRHSEKSRLRKGLAIIVATPGRLLDHLHKTQSLALSLKGGKFQWLVLDEADRLLDMGLGDQVRQIVQWIRANEASKQYHTEPWWRSVLVSATVTPSVQSLAKERMLCGNQAWIWVKGEKLRNSSNSNTCPPSETTSNHPTSASADGDTAPSENYATSTPRQLAQFHLTVTAKLRLSTLVAFLVQRISKGERTVVFMGTCATVDYHYQLFHAMKDSLWDSEEMDEMEDSNISSWGLFGKKARVFKLHGSVPHAKRVQTMEEFSNANSSSKTTTSAAILLTTDVAARGLNLDSIDWTVQYDPPCEISDYVHRVGRGARAGKAGHSLLFLLPSERKYLDVLETKGITNLNPLSLSTLLNEAATTCTQWTKAGIEHGGGSSSSDQSQRNASRMQHSRSGEFFCIEVQRRLEECVVDDDMEARKLWKEKQKLQQRKRKAGKSGSKDVKKEGQLLSMARDAFVSFLRAYPTKKEPIVRSIFSSRALHLGHVAKSFALKEPPTAVVSKTKSKHQQQQEESQDQHDNLPRSLEFEEAPSHMEDILAQVDKREPTGYSKDDEDEFRANKRQKNFKTTSAKALLLANAVKMQNNLMDAM